MSQGAQVKNCSETTFDDMKEPLMKFFLSQVVAGNFTEKQLNHFVMGYKVFLNSYSCYSVAYWWTAAPRVAYMNEKGHALLN